MRQSITVFIAELTSTVSVRLPPRGRLLGVTIRCDSLPTGFASL